MQTDARTGCAGSVAARRPSSRATCAAKSPHTASALVAKYRKNVRRLMPAESATSSLVTFSKPRQAKRSSAARSTRARGSPAGVSLVRVTGALCRSPPDRRTGRDTRAVLPLAPGVTNVRGTQPCTPPRRSPMPETPQTDAPVLEVPVAAEEELVEESLVEEVSIDGMCGVY